MADETPNEATPEETPKAVAPEETPEAVAPEAPAEEVVVEEVADETPVAAAPADDAPAGDAPAADAPAAAEAPEANEDDEEVERAPRVKPSIPGMDLEVDIVTEGEDPLGRETLYDEDGEEIVPSDDDDDVVDDQPIVANVDLSADARYRATGKRKTGVARVILKPGTGVYTINGKTLDVFFPRVTLQRNIRQPLETVGYEDRMDVVATIHGGGVSSQAGALRHGISKALLEADPNLRGELKRRGFLTRDARVKERKKAGLKKARKKPQFSKR
ncbi:MAG: rpsI [Solirubrobacterales bacterium]|nr:rpsI [Solirubrobacterales bacterium]